MNGFPKNARVCFIGDSITHNNGFVSRILLEKNIEVILCTQAPYDEYQLCILPYRNLRFTGGLLRESPLTIKSVKIEGVNLDFYTL